MAHNRNWPLLVGALLSGLVALLHVGCIVFGAPWYRFFGAGEEMALLAEAGDARPMIVTAVIVGVFVVWSAYALAGAGVLRRLPFTRLVLVLITSVYLLRGVAFIVIVPFFPDNDLGFWIWSSVICLSIGLVHSVGMRRLFSARKMSDEPGVSHG